jgi:hypothetical protein
MPTGTVTFNIGSTPLGAIQLSSGTAVLTTSSLAAGQLPRWFAEGSIGLPKGSFDANRCDPCP